MSAFDALLWSLVAVVLAWHSRSLYRIGGWRYMLDGWGILAVSAAVVLPLRLVWGVSWWMALAVNLIVMSWTRDRLRDWHVLRSEARQLRAHFYSPSNRGTE